jgi:hypothetical protein
MTLDEAIKHCEEIAEEQNKLCERCDRASGYSRSHNEAIRTSDAKKHEKCGQEHIQLAAWLRELKAYKEQEPCNSCCGGDQKEKAKLCQKSYLAGLEHRQEPCADAISREAALMCMTGKYIVDLEYKPEDIISQHIKRIKALPSVTPKQKWFPVSEKLPEEGKTVMASTNYGIYPEARYSKKYGWEWPWEAGADYWTGIVDSVEAWMELPEPYKAGSEGRNDT